MLTQDSAMGSMARARERRGKGGRRAAYIVSVAGSKEVEHHLGGRGKVLEALEHFCTGRGGVTTRGWVAEYYMDVERRRGGSGVRVGQGGEKEGRGMKECGAWKFRQRCRGGLPHAVAGG